MGVSEIRGNVRSNIEEHAVCLAVPEALASCIRFTQRLACREGVLCPTRFKVVCGCGLYVRDDTAACAGGSPATY